MNPTHDAVLLRIFIGESGRWQHRPLYEAILLKAWEMLQGGLVTLQAVRVLGGPDEAPAP